MQTHYQIRRKTDHRIIAGIFTPITSRAMALTVLERWKRNFPKETFYIKEV